MGNKTDRYNGYDSRTLPVVSSLKRAGGMTPGVEQSFIKPRFEDSKVLLRLEQQQERLNEQHNLTPSPAEISFDQEALSPFLYPLDGQDYNLDKPPSDRVMDGMCPLCSNAAHREIDAFYLQNLEDQSAWKQYSFSQEQVLHHVVNHVGAIYMEALRERGKNVAAEEAIKKLVDKANAAKEAKTNTAKDNDTQDTPERPTAIDVVIKAIAKARQKKAAYNRAFRSFKGEDDEQAEERVIICPLSSPGSKSPDPEYCGVPMVVVQSNTGKGLAGRRYAFDYDEQLGPLRPWGDGRVNTEISARKDDAINFYDEMMTVRSMAKRVYSEIMDGEREPIYNKSGEMTGYKDKNYGSAIQAARVVKDVAMDMAKLALIATKDGDDKDQKRNLSSTMQSMLTDMGIYSRDDTKVVEEQLRAVPTAEMIEMTDALFPTEEVDPSEFGPVNHSEFDKSEFHE